MPTAILLVFLIVIGAISFFFIAIDGFKKFAPIGVVLVPVFIGLIVWMSLSYFGREIDTECETFHSVMTIARGNTDIQHIIVEDEGSINFIVMNKKVKGAIQKDVFVRRYCLEQWKNGINFLRLEEDWKYELIGPEHERYEEAQKEAVRIK